MTTEASTFSRPIRIPIAAHKAYTRPGFVPRFRHFIEFSDWDEKILAQEAWLNKVCTGIILVAALYFLPALAKVFLG